MLASYTFTAKTLKLTLVFGRTCLSIIFYLYRYIDIRNKKIAGMSYIDTAVLRIGDETIEVKGGENTNEYWINGILGEPDLKNGKLTQTIAGRTIKFDRLGGNQNRRRFVIDLGNDEEIIFKTFKLFVRVNIRAKIDENFNTSVGLMGTYPDGNKVGRDGIEIDDINDFGADWQVQAFEPKIFHNLEGPQVPMKCRLPTAISTSRRLGESKITLEQAELACVAVDEEDRDDCIEDVLATEDMDMAGAY